MAVVYASSVTTQDRLFWIRLLLRWTGSVYKLIYVDLFVYVLCYVLIALTYRVILSNDPRHKVNFEGVVQYFRSIQSLAPLSFMLGFFVSSVLSRWWDSMMTIPWMSKASFLVQSYVVAVDSTSESEKVARDLRYTVLRHMNLAWAISLSDISRKIRDRFDYQRSSTSSDEYRLSLHDRLVKLNQDAMVKKTFGYLITQEEMSVIEAAAERHKKTPTEAKAYNWQPLQWSTRLLQRGLQCGVIRTDRNYNQLIQMLVDLRSSLGKLSMRAKTNIPLVYVQVVVIAVYSYFIAELFTAQFIDKSDTSSRSIRSSNSTIIYPVIFSSEEFNAYVPIISVLKFLFFMGWFKVGVSLLDPFGDDEEDFPLDDIFDSNLEISIDLGLANTLSYPTGLTAEVACSSEDAATCIKSLTSALIDFGSSADDSKNTGGEDENVSLIMDAHLQIELTQI